MPADAFCLHCYAFVRRRLLLEYECYRVAFLRQVTLLDITPHTPLRYYDDIRPDCCRRHCRHWLSCRHTPCRPCLPPLFC